MPFSFVRRALIGAVGLAAALQERAHHHRKRVGVPLCGGNVDSAVFAGVLASA